MCQCAKSPEQRQFTFRFILNPVCDIFKQSNLLDRAILSAASFTLYKLETKNLHPQVAKRQPEDFFNFKLCWSNVR